MKLLSIMCGILYLNLLKDRVMFDRQTDGWMDRQIYAGMDRQKMTQAGRQTDKQKTDKETDNQPDFFLLDLSNSSQ